MKKLLPLLFVFVLISIFSFGQDKDLTGTPPKPQTQTLLQNDFYAGYGGFSVFYFTGINSGSFDLIRTSNLKDEQSAGTFFLGYQRSLNTVVSTGFLFGYQNFNRTGMGYIYQSDNTTPEAITVNNNLIMGIARVTFNYVNKPVIRMYSGIGIGLTINLSSVKLNGQTDHDRKLLPGGQLTLMGLRFGRAFGGFVEFGFGTYGIVNAGLSYKFKD
jgi:hypothetical protein